MLSGMGFKEVYNLKGGIRAWQGFKTAGPAEVGMALITGKETPSEMIVIAYGMEEGLRGFYTETAEKISDQDAVDLFHRLADIEVLHKNRIFELYRTLGTEGLTREDFETRIVPDVMEGGMTTEEFLRAYGPALESVDDVLDVAMTLEGQALDLYLRYSFQSKDEKTKNVLYDISEEEKKHLRMLGEIKEKQVASSSATGA